MIKSPETKQGRPITTPEIPVDTGREPPAFCFRHLIGGYRIPDCNQNEKAALSDTLHQLTQRTWNDLIQQDRHKRGCEKISQSALKISLPGNITPDQPLLVFRFCGKAPMIGFRSGRILHVICIDPKFKAYTH